MSALSAAASDEDADTIRQQRERIEELESQLEAVGAGGVGPLMPQGHVKQPSAETLTAGDRAVERDELLQVALNFIEELTGMQPPPIEIAPPEVFAPFLDFVDSVQAVADRRSAPLPKKKPLTEDEIVEIAFDTNSAIETKSSFYVPLGFARAIERAHDIGGDA